MVSELYTNFAINHIARIHDISDLRLIRLSKWSGYDKYPTFGFARYGVDDIGNTMNIYYSDGIWGMSSHSGVGFDYVLLSSGITPFIHFLDGHGHEIDFNEIRRTFGIEEEDK